MKKIITLIVALSISLLTVHKAGGQDTIYVPQDHQSIQAAIDAAVDGNVVLVDTGTYLENISFNGKAITLASKYIWSQDEFYRDHTVIDGSNAPDPDSATTVLFISGEDSTSVLTGFTITGGAGTRDIIAGTEYFDGGGIKILNSGAKICDNLIMNNNLYNDDTQITGVTGGGISVLLSDPQQHVIIENNIIRNNTAIADQGRALGGGLVCGREVQAWVRIENNIIRENHVQSNDEYAVGGGIYVESVNAHVSGNTLEKNSCVTMVASFALGGGLCFYANTNPQYYTFEVFDNVLDSNSVKGWYAYGAGIRANGGKIQIEDNLFVKNVIVDTPNYNRGAAITLYWLEEPGVIRNNQFMNNSNVDGEGGAIYVNSQTFQNLEIEGNLFEGNDAKIGGAAWSENSNVEFYNNVFTNNTASSSGGALYLAGDVNNPIKNPYEVTNNSFFDNDAANYGGAIYSSFGDPLVINSIFCSDSAANGEEIRNLAGTLELSYCDIDTNHIYGDFTAGDGIISENPMFDTLGYTCQLQDGSPCIDAGTPDTTELGLPP
ncbi:MAG: right-handed parallel beta-helix repeat-containing protein [Bacteroidales bacterium]|nr:right-handed parallel beta-helix repeat-containing protein [Bacteroidales bacterium]MCF8345440.1 right-handed parallel beta-helix repeat-containing protein [Bacteroidales bacterium]MCF8351014.1 right-handed parallel beta-helix repeat-containing protein [Bacteroidales bacterium]MCF8377866.1 right-handed parallel beta-helix repeat-containing protein [Bacteroidales bacterium]